MRWVPTETGKYFSKKEMEGDGREFLFNFFFARTKPIWTHLSLRFINNTKTLANSSLEVFPRGHHRPFLNSKGVIISMYCQLHFLAWMEIKSHFRPCITYIEWNRCCRSKRKKNSWWWRQRSQQTRIEKVKVRGGGGLWSQWLLAQKWVVR